jgi:hypothetical protein
MQSLGKNKTPYEKGTEKKPNLWHLYEWGSTVWVKKIGTRKLDGKAKKGHFVGFDEESKGYHVYWPIKKKVSIERDIYFNKDESLQPNNIQIKEEWDIPVNLDSTKVDSKPNNTPKYTKPADNDLNLQTNNNKINSTENAPKIQSVLRLRTMCLS